MLLSTQEFKRSLETALRDSEEITILSAFLKKEALKWLLSNSQAKSIKVVSRWQKNDLVVGASDFECYEICAEKGIDFGVSLDLHGKVYLIDDQMFVGSANLTSRGLGLIRNPNDEFGTGFKAGAADKKKVQSFLSEVIWLDVEKAKSMKIELGENISRLDDWSHTLKEILTCQVNHLWVHELPFLSPAELLGLDLNSINDYSEWDWLRLDFESTDVATVRSAFRQTNCYKWLAKELEKSGELRFGAVSSKLHHALLDDPKPYRKKVKTLVSILFEWFELLDDYSIIQPGYSQIIRKKSRF